MSNSTSYTATITGSLIADPKKSVIDTKNGKKTIWNFAMAKDAKDGGRKSEEKDKDSKATYWINFTFRGDSEILDKVKKGSVLTVTATKPYLMDEYSYSPYSFNSEKGYASASEKLDAFGVTYGSYVTKKEGEAKPEKEETVEDIIDSPESFFPPDELIPPAQDTKKMEKLMKEMPFGVDDELELIS